jgi:hypothetical protein
MKNVWLFQVEVFWIVSPFSAVAALHHDDGGGMDLWNVDIVKQR